MSDGLTSELLFCRSIWSDFFLGNIWKCCLLWKTSVISFMLFTYFGDQFSDLVLFIVFWCKPVLDWFPESFYSGSTWNDFSANYTSRNIDMWKEPANLVNRVLRLICIDLLKRNQRSSLVCGNQFGFLS